MQPCLLLAIPDSEKRTLDHHDDEEQKTEKYKQIKNRSYQRQLINRTLNLSRFMLKFIILIFL